ncbi:hypothetical protein F4861DRAFT_541921 [Xylaria intraflava]|nr:hypothetical protein F4861DRAFT_541921 [Xylaria intraflava]
MSGSTSTITPRGRSPQNGHNGRPDGAYDGIESQKQANHHLLTRSSCERCQGKIGERVTRFDLPLIAVARGFNAILGFATVVRIHTAIDAGWWPWEHKILFILCWIQFLWNLLHCSASVLGYQFWPSSRRTVGLPPISITVGNRTIASFGGANEDDIEKRRRYKRLQFTIVDLILALPSLGFLIYSAHIMYPWWGSRYVGLWSPTIGLIASLISFELLTAIFQLFQFFEAKVVGVQLSMQDIYEKEHASGRLQL